MSGSKFSKKNREKAGNVLFNMPNHEQKGKDTERNNNWKSHTNLTHPGKYFRPSKVKIMRPTSPK